MKQSLSIFDFIWQEYPKRYLELPLIRKELDDFKARFPLSSLPNMTMEEYVTEGNPFCFINMIENKTGTLASGFMGVNRNRLISQHKNSRTREICKFIRNGEKNKGLSDNDIFKNFVNDLHNFIRDFDEKTYVPKSFLSNSNVLISKLIMIYREDVNISGFTAKGPAVQTARHLGISLLEEEDALSVDMKIKAFLYEKDPEIKSLNIYVVGKIIWDFYAKFIKENIKVKNTFLETDRKNDIAVNEGIDTAETNDVPENERKAPPKPIEIGGSLIYPRDPAVSKKALKDAHYLCECDERHKTFIKKSNDKPYTESHHLIPMAAQDDYPKQSLDVGANIISLCSHCHNQLHYGKDIEKIIEFFFYKRKDKLQKLGIKITYKKLLSYYK